ncbi:MAG: hypothetical protein ABI843_12915 [Dokdonella sp.]
MSKPRWLSKDAATRRTAVAEDTDNELVANLGRLAREDEDAGVRLAAMKRLADPGIVQGLARDDVDANVRKQARSLWFDLLSGAHAAAPVLPDRLRLLKAQDDNELIEHLARHAREPELRRAALDRVQRPALWFDRALEDADPTLRLAATERIGDEAQLLRLAERARKTDKQVSRRARERVDALRMLRGDGATLELRARSLCERMEQLLRKPQAAVAEEELTTNWNEIEARVDVGLRQRFESARSLLLISRCGPRQTLPAEIEQSTAPGEPDAQTPVVEAMIPIESTSAEAEPAKMLVAPLLAQARFAASLDTVNAERELEHERQRALTADIERALTPLEQAIESGASLQAHAAKVQLDALRRRSTSALPRALITKLAAIEQRYAELSQWQRWADNQRRQQLCDDIETLAGSGLHPDAIATRVREAQTEWTRLEAAEGESGRAGGLGRRFHSACRNALAPTQAYFKKRQELRQSHAQQVATLLGRVAALPDDAADWAGMLALRREVAEALRGLDRVEPRERKALAERLKTGLGALDVRVARRDEEIARVKAGLIAQAEALGRDMPRGAVASARELQQRWQLAGNGRRERDQMQWKSFRGAIDSVFGRLDAERAERGARDQEARLQAETVCTELETQAAMSDKVDRGAVARLEAAWDALRFRDDALSGRFRAAQSRLRDGETRRQRGLRQARFDAWLARYAICRDAENALASPDALRERWSAAPSTDIGADALSGRFEAALDGTPLTSNDDDAARDVLIELDFLAGAEAPEAERERRRQLQLERLSVRMRGGAALAPYDELANLLVRWSELGAITHDGRDERIERSVRGALATLA